MIADAPWIREAERDGFPPYEVVEVDYDPAIKRLKLAEKALAEAEDQLLCAEDSLIGTGSAEKIREMFGQVEDLEVDIRLMRKSFQRMEG